MGVSAIFVSTIAITRLPEAQSPPENQAQLLALTLQPIVSFVVLGSIIIRTFFVHLCYRFSQVLNHFATDGFSIPFFTLGRHVHSRTLSRSQSLTSPDWLLSTTRGAQASSVAHDVEAGVTSQLGEDGKTRTTSFETVHSGNASSMEGFGVPVLNREQVLRGRSESDLGATMTNIEARNGTTPDLTTADDDEKVAFA
jgi:hypothetical protein